MILFHRYFLVTERLVELNGIILTPYTGKFLGPIARYILGPIMNAIFVALDKVLGNFDSGLVGLSIIIFTIVIYLLLMPLTIKQQKFSKLQARMNPEIQAIQAKYKDKKDQDSMMAMNAETKAVYAKYGVSPSGSCVQLLIQMPILFALYRVMYSLPAYINVLYSKFEVIANNVINSGLVDEVKELKSSLNYVKNFDIPDNQVNAVIDCLNSMNVADLTKYAGTSADCVSALEKIKTYNYFLGMNLSNSPSYMISEAWSNAGGKQWGVLIAAILIPILAGVTQWLNVKLMPQPEQNNSQPQSETAQSMNQSMKMMNNFMPIMSIVFCFSFSAGIGIYWIAGSVIRSIQQVVVNKQIDKIDVDALIKKNEAKRRKQLEKAGIDPDKVSAAAKINTRNINSNNSKPRRSMNEKANIGKTVSNKKQDEALNEAMAAAAERSKNYDPNSIAAKANLVSQYNNRKDN